ncbi:MAG: DNA ligase D [Chloroflexota bacterium]|nr:DNA ligase D [Chloroflexota bacterium]
MPLETYRSKRNFTKTPEPAGRKAGSGSGRFVVQRHRATALHYDFRLEIDGVLVSWAIPKGPSLNPADRRLAMRTEDHPVEYFDFEGIIPKGEYGAGDVIVWDWGTFEPEETDSPARAIASGELKFRLDGEKLHGRFTIVRTDRDGDRERWLLMKKRDEAADPNWDIDALPRSVKSGRTNDDVAEGREPARGVEAPMPDFIPPMLATAVADPFDNPDWLFEVKWDGYRVEAVVSDGKVRLYTRNRQNAATYFPDLAGPPDWIAARQAIVDGEVVALDEQGRPSFSLLQEVSGLRGPGTPRGSDHNRASKEERAAIPLAYQVFDLLYYDGHLLVDVSLEERKSALRDVLRPHPGVRYAGHVVGEGLAFIAAAREKQLEGVVAKLRASAYESGHRSRSWLKIKLRREQELVVAGWLPGKGSHAQLGSLIVAVYDGDRLRHAGQVGSGINERMRAELRRQLDALARDSSPLDSVPRLPQARWVEPRIVIRAEFAEWTRDGLLRQAAFKGLEIDRDPRQVHREEPIATAQATATAERAAKRRPRRALAPSASTSEKTQSVAAPEKPATPSKQSTGSDGSKRSKKEAPGEMASPDELAALDRMGKEGEWKVGGRELRLTNLDKILFPAAGEHEAITKRELIRYYAGIAPILIPYLRDRAVNLHRYPDGIGSSRGFWQKDVPGHAPKWVTRWSYTGHEGTKDYVVVDHVATLGWLAQEAAIEIHPWTSPTHAPDRPSYALIDVDPGEATSWQEIVALTRLFRTALEHLGVTGLPKVTGQRGMQVWVPVKPIYSFEQTRDWVESVSRAVGQAVPQLVSWEWSKRARGGKARLDYTQNAVNKTLVAPYGVRPRAGAPVSAPIAWDELDDPKLRPDRWTIHTIGERLERVGDLFAAALELKQELPSL